MLPHFASYRCAQFPADLSARAVMNHGLSPPPEVTNPSRLPNSSMNGGAA